MCCYLPYRLLIKIFVQCLHTTDVLVYNFQLTIPISQHTKKATMANEESGVAANRKRSLATVHRKITARIMASASWASVDTLQQCAVSAESVRVVIDNSFHEVLGASLSEEWKVVRQAYLTAALDGAAMVCDDCVASVLDVNEVLRGLHIVPSVIAQHDAS